MKPLCVELFCGCFGWSAGWLAMGGRAVGFDIEHLPHHGPVPHGAELVLQDVLTLHGSQFRDADLILASPPCTEYSYMAMPWSRAKQIAAALREGVPFPDGYTGSRMITELNALFNACFRIQREACEAAGRHIPMVVENVKGAQPWVGRAQANFGSYYLWGDVGMVGRKIVAKVPKFGEYVQASGRRMKFPAGCGPRMWRDRETPRLNDGSADPAAHAMHMRLGQNPVTGVKSPGLNWNGHGNPDYKPQGFNVRNAQRYREENGTKQGGEWWHDPDSMTRRFSSKSDSRKAASALIAKIPYALSEHIARIYWRGYGVPDPGEPGGLPSPPEPPSVGSSSG